MRAIVVAAIAVAAAVNLSPSLARAADEDPVIAIVNGEKVPRSELLAAHDRLPDQYRQMPIEQIFEPLLGRVIDNRLLAAEAEKQKIQDKDGFKQAMADAKRAILREQLMQSAIEEGSTKEKIQQAYMVMSQQPGFAAEEVRAKHVLVKTEAEAKEILAAIAKGTAFDELAKERSIDPSAKQNGGDLGYFRREMMVAPFAEAAFKIQPGTVGTEPVESQFGWHVIRVEDRRQAVPSLEEKEQELRDVLARDIVTGLLQKVRVGASIQRFDLEGKPLPN